MKISLKLLFTISMLLFITLSCKKDPEQTQPASEPLPKVHADFSLSPTDATAPATIQFTNNSENADSYFWDFGDGNTSAEKSPSHNYENEGDYTVSLKASNKESEDIASQTVTILPPPNTLLGRWVLTSGTYNNSIIPNLEAEVEFKSEAQYSASFSHNSNSGSVKANYTLETDIRLKSNLPENMLINGISMSRDSNGNIYWQASVSSSRDAFLNYGGVALGWSRSSDYISIGLDAETLIFKSKDGRTILNYKKA